MFSLNHWQSLPEARLQRIFWMLALTVMGLRLVFLWSLPLDLSGDESYYWDWGRHLAWGYYSKPPGIGWLMALAGWIGNDTAFGIRMFAVLLSTGSLCWLFYLTRRLYGGVAALLAVLILLATPINIAINYVLTIDAPLLFCWTLALFAFWEFIQPNSQRLKWGTVLSLALAGGILSKQVMLGFPPLACGFLLFSRAYRGELLKPGIWICFCLGALALLPPLYWNITHDWVTLQHTLHHFEAEKPGLSEHVKNFFTFIGSQLGIITPVTYVLLIAMLGGALLAWRRLADRERFLFAFSGPGLLGVLLLALRQEINPNWPGMFFASGFILLAGWVSQGWSLQTGLDRWRRAFAPGLKFGVVLTLLVYGLVVALAHGWVRLPGLDPSARLRGWSILAEQVHEVRSERDLTSLPVMTQGHRYLTSELAFYLPDHPRVYLHDTEPEVVLTQYDLWPVPATDIGHDMLIVVQGKPEQLDAPLAQRFRSTETLAELTYTNGSRVQPITVMLGRELQR